MKPFRGTLKAIKRRLSTMVVRRNYGISRPGVVRLPGSPARLHIDPDDPRAYKILVVAPLLGRFARNVPFWREACSRLTPSLALDIGMNFGECLFSGEYAPQTELHGFEANSRLKPYVTRSLMEHPARRQMQLHFAVVADRPGPHAEFYVDRRWSGGSTAHCNGISGDRYDTIRMPRVSVDSVLESSRAARPGKTLVFKIDIEGFEFHALQGMERTIAAPRWALGLIEFDTHMLSQAGESLERCWTFLTERFDVYAFGRGTRATPVTSWGELTRLFRTQDFHTDLLLVRGGGDERLEEFLNEWTTRRPTPLRHAA